MKTLVHEMRGIPFFLLKEYLQELGGQLTAEDTVAGDGWSVRLERMEPFRLGSLEVGQTRLTMELRDDVAEDFLERFRLKTLRAGG
ncbi:MAG: DUF1952 domain-containing protein, partial [Anaerolineales bacterium]|nr:DUF1952 domain-containing protein [Anaerolineales bacterium]MCX7755199.1 DUF1952 domain-containing protein [Anaerolineales bacterium]MDW8278801.1 DUF1952 domain-containing protein [Anaerolineales bacterium]